MSRSRKICLRGGDMFCLCSACCENNDPLVEIKRLVKKESFANFEKLPTATVTYTLDLHFKTRDTA